MKRIRLERGDDDDDEPPEPELVEAELTKARIAEGLLPPAVVGAAGGDDGKSDDEDGKAGGSEGRRRRGSRGKAGEGKGDASPDADADAAAAAAATAAPPQLPPQPLPPRKRLTCVLFGDTNTHILLTGDASGRVDVYRVLGIAAPGSSVAAAPDEDDSVDASVAALQRSLATLK